MGNIVHERISNSKTSRKWIREPKISDAECAELLYEEIESLMRESDIFYGQHALLANHYRTLSIRAMTA